MKSRRIVIPLFAVLLLAAAAAAAALYLSSRRELTTSSSAASAAYRAAVEDEQRFYRKDARVGFAKALELDPEFAMAMLGLARVSDRDQAKSLVERARRQRDHLTERERFYVDMQHAYMNGKADEGLRVAHLLHEKYPKDPRSAMVLASVEMEKGNADRALQIYQDLTVTDPNYAVAYNYIGYYYGFRGDYDRAIENLKKYQFLAPDQANPYDSMAEVQANSGRYDEAIQNLNRALAIKADFDPGYQHLGLAYEGKGDSTRAIEFYEKAADNAVSDGLRGAYLAGALRVALSAKDRAAASRITTRLGALPKSDYSEVVKPYLEVGRHLLENRPADAERLLREVKPKLYALLSKGERGSRRKPYDAGWNFLMGMALEAQGKEAEAIPVYEEMANPPNPWTEFESRRWVYEGRARLAALLARRGDLDRAEKLLAENRKWNPSWAPTRTAEETVAQARRAQVVAAAK